MIPHKFVPYSTENRVLAVLCFMSKSGKAIVGGDRFYSDRSDDREVLGFD